MPADRPDAPKRSHSGGGPNLDERQRDTERRRLEGKIACAECSRLKAKCDRKIPCASCTRRGCPSICPNQTLAGGHGTRFVLADTEKLHQRLAEMSERIRQLEDALAIATAHSSELHPLLRKELRAIRHDLGVENTTENSNTVPEDQDLDDFGALTISQDGVARFLGRTGGSESLIEASANSEALRNQQDPSSSRFASPASRSPTPAAPNVRVNRVIAELPPYEEGLSLCEIYLEQSPWHLRMVQRQHLIDDIFTPIYNRKHSAGQASSEPADLNGDVAILLMTMALGCLADMNRPPFNEEATHLYKLARSIVTLDIAGEHPSLSVVQTLAMMAIFTMFSDGDTLELANSYMQSAIFLGEAIGLHRDPARWGLCDKMVQRRRHVFWQLFNMQNWQGLVTGRPMLFRLEFSDCKFPNEDHEAATHSRYMQRWMYQYGRDVIYAANNLVCKVGPVKYSEILEIDKKIREFPDPDQIQREAGGTQGRSKARGFLDLLWRDGTMLCLHRSYFAKALLHHPLDPCKSPYAASFLATYRSALSMLKLVREHYDLFPHSLARSWMLWKHVFSSLVTVGTIVIRGPKSPAAQDALYALGVGTDFFERSAACAHWTTRGLAVLLPLRDRAFQTFRNARVEKSPIFDNLLLDKQQEDWGEELAIFGGQRWVLRKGDSGKRVEASASTSPEPPLAIPSEQRYARDEPLPETGYEAYTGFGPQDGYDASSMPGGTPDIAAFKAAYGATSWHAPATMSSSTHPQVAQPPLPAWQHAMRGYPEHYHPLAQVEQARVVDSSTLGRNPNMVEVWSHFLHENGLPMEPPRLPDPQYH